MVPSGPPTPIGGAQSVTPSLLRSNSGMLGGQGGPMPSQGAFPSLVSPRTQFPNGNLLGNVPNVSSFLNQSFGNGGANTGISASGNGPRGGVDAGAESDPLSGIGSGVGFNPTSSFAGNMANPGASGQVQGQQFPNSSGNQMLPDQPQSQQLEAQNFQQQFSANQQSQRQQFQSVRGGLGGVVPVKMEPQVTSDQHGPSQQHQQLPSLRGLGQVKLEPQQLQTMRGLGPVKLEPQQHSDQSLFLHQQQQHQQQQQQQLLQQMSMSRQSSQAAAAFQLNLLHQQRLLQLQQQQQQQLLKAIPQQRGQLQQQFAPQNLPLRSPVKQVYEPGMCARRLTYYMYQQQHRPEVGALLWLIAFLLAFFCWCPFIRLLLYVSCAG